jgi:hypothetical protein
MSGQKETTADVLGSVWLVSHDHDEMDEDCSPTKSCRNMKDVTFDGYAEPGSDLGAAWRAKLAREGKLSTPGTSLRDLILGQGEQS